MTSQSASPSQVKIKKTVYNLPETTTRAAAVSKHKYGHCGIEHCDGVCPAQEKYLRCKKAGHFKSVYRSSEKNQQVR